MRTRYVTGVDNDPFSTRPYTSETRLLRVSNGAVQYSNVVDYAERIGMTDNAGIAYTFGAAMNVLDWTPIFTTSFEPVIPLVNGNTAMHEVSTGLLHEVNAAGVSVASGAFGGRWGYQSAFGLWTSAESGQLTARLSLPLNEAGISFQFLGRMGTGQNAPPDKTFPDREIAGLKALDFIYDTSADANFEYGGLICHRNGRFEWSEIRTSRNQSMVVVPDTLCPPGALAARYHTHPGLESPVPSDPGDYDHATANPGIPNYLRTRLLGTPAVRWRPFPTQTLSWWKGASREAVQNVCVKQPVGWAPYTAGVATSAGAVCAPATP